MPVRDLGNGVVVDFGNMSEQDIDKALAQPGFQQQIGEIRRPTVPAAQQPQAVAQVPGLMRYPEMGLREFATGAAGAAGIPGNLLNSVGRPGVLPTSGQIENALGLNAPSGLEPQTPGERIFAGAARGAGAALPVVAALGPIGGAAVPMMGGLNAAGALALGAGTGAATQGLEELGVPGWEGELAGAGLGLLGGAGAAAVRGSTVVPRIVDQLGATDATLASAGRGIKGELAARMVQSQMRLGKPLDLSSASQQTQNLLNRVITMEPSNISRNMLRNPEALEILRNEMPDQVDQLAGARLNINARTWSNLDPDVQEALIPDASTRQKIGAATSIGGPGIVHGLAASTLGYMLGAGAAHLGLIPGGEVVGAGVGELTALGMSALRSRAAARMIVDPWVIGATSAGALGGYGGGLSEPAPSLPQ